MHTNIDGLINYVEKIVISFKIIQQKKCVSIFKSNCILHICNCVITIFHMLIGVQNQF